MEEIQYREGSGCVEDVSCQTKPVLDALILQEIINVVVQNKPARRNWVEYVNDADTANVDYY